MDESGVAAEVVFAGGQNFEELPFMGKGWNAGLAGVRTELRSSAQVIWNRWLAEFITASPTRLMGVLQNPVWDIDLAVQEIEWGAARGLRVVNLPAPRRDFPAYTDRAYDKLWAACVDNGCVLTTHSGGGEEPLGIGAAAVELPAHRREPLARQPRPRAADLRRRLPPLPRPEVHPHRAAHRVRA